MILPSLSTMTIRVELNTPELANVPGGISNDTRKSSFLSTIVSSVMAISVHVTDGSGDGDIVTTRVLVS